MFIQSNFNIDFLLERDCWNVEIETDDNEKYYFTYKSTKGFVIGYFVTKEEALFTDKWIDVKHGGIVSFILNEELTHGEIQIERKDILGKIIIPFLILEKSDVTFYKKRLTEIY